MKQADASCICPRPEQDALCLCSFYKRFGVEKNACCAGRVRLTCLISDQTYAPARLASLVGFVSGSETGAGLLGAGCKKPVRRHFVHTIRPSGNATVCSQAQGFMTGSSGGGMVFSSFSGTVFAFSVFSSFLGFGSSCVVFRSTVCSHG